MGCTKNPASAGWLDCLICGQGSGGTPDSGKALLRSRPRPKLPATTGQRAVTRESASCRNQLLIVYSAAESGLAAETLFQTTFGCYFWLVGDLAVRAGNVAKRSLQELLCPRKFHRS